MNPDASHAAETLRAMRSFLGANDMVAHVATMAVCLMDLHRVWSDPHHPHR